MCIKITWRWHFKSVLKGVGRNLNGEGGHGATLCRFGENPVIGWELTTFLAYYTGQIRDLKGDMWTYPHPVSTEYCMGFLS